MISFFSPKVEYVENKYAKEIQSNLLKSILLITCVISSIIVLLAILNMLPLGKTYTTVLYFYISINAVMYYLMIKNDIYYTFSVNILIFSSLVTFSFMTVDATYDEFRFIWFFLLSFTAFVLGGKWYGVLISFIVYVLIILLYFIAELNLSKYVLFTFLGSFLVFNMFNLYFINKIKIDVNTLQERICEETDKRQTQEQVLLRQYRMTNMGEMIDAIAHQWRQPLAQGNMILFNMLEELDNKTYLEEKIEELTKLNMHMSQTIDDFRFLLNESKNKTIFDIHTAIEEVLTLMKKQLETINIDYTNRVTHKIKGYKNELIQVLVVLLSNAIEVLEIRDIQNKKISFLLEECDDCIMIHIDDNAGGVEPSVQDKLFDPYISTKQTSGGTGLGLYIAQIIIEDNMRGKLSVKDGLHGARFTIEIKREL